MHDHVLLVRLAQCAENRYRGDIDTFFSNFEYCGHPWPQEASEVPLNRDLAG